MQLQFLLGRAGSGKTHTCLQEIRQALQANPDGPPLIFLTPEQATFQMERALLTAKPAEPAPKNRSPFSAPGNDIPQPETRMLRATHRAHVLSFQRLATRVMQEAGGPPYPRLGLLGKRMMLRSLLQKQKDQLRLFGRSTGQPGFIDQLAQTLTELRSYRCHPATLERQAQLAHESAEGSDILSAKLHDLAIVYREFTTQLADGFVDPDEVLDLVAERIPIVTFLRGARVWVDGFAGFTPQEFNVLRAIWRTAAQVTVALCLDEEPDEEPATTPQHDNVTDLFAPTRDTYRQLCRMAKEDGLTIRPIRRLDRPSQPPPRFANAPALAHLEAHLFRRPTIPYPHRLNSQTGTVTITAAAHPALEVEAAAREILRLCREEGCRFRDISVILRDMNAYQDLIRAVFNDYNIPHFIDSRRSITHHPLVELLRSAFEVHMSGWAPEPIFRCLRTDLFPIPRDAVDRLENYVLEHGLHGEAWLARNGWSYARRYSLTSTPAPLPTYQQEELRHINAWREQAAGPLRRFSLALSRSNSVRDVAEAVWSLLSELQVADTLAAWTAEAEANGLLESAREHAGAWDGVIQLLDDMVQALGAETLSPKACLQVIESGLESLNLGMIPPGLDQVLVGSAERSRQPDIRAALILGVREGTFPPPPPEDAILNDGDREELAERMPLAPTSRTLLLHEQYLTYITLTRANQFLWLSYPTGNTEGKALEPAPIVTRIQKLFPHAIYKVEVPEPKSDEDYLERLLTPRQLISAVAEHLRQQHNGEPITNVWWDLYDWTVTDGELRRLAQPVYAALDYRNAAAPLPPDVTKALYGPVLRTSVSRLESFATCPFQHFAAHALRLQERPRFRLDRLQVGTFLHAALRQFVDRLQQEGRAWSDLTDEEVQRWGEECVDELVPQLHSEILLSSARHRFLTDILRRNVLWALASLTEHARRSQFQPVAAELAFGRPGSALPPWRVSLADGSSVHLSGQIDRIDLARDAGGRHWVRILDYKSRSRDLPPADIVHGLALQLPVYLSFVLEHAHDISGAPLHPAGLLYFPLREPRLRQDAPASDAALLAALRRHMRMRGLFIDDPAIVRLMDTDLGTGESDLIHIRINKTTGQIGKQANVAAADRFDSLFSFVRHQVATLATQIKKGRVDIHPYLKGSQRPCQYCSFRPLCQFDTRVPGNAYRRLPALSAEEAWAQIERLSGASEAAASGERANPGFMGRRDSQPDKQKGGGPQ